MIHILLFLIAFAIPPDYEDCESIKNGAFRMSLEAEGQPPIFTEIERTGDIQYERIEQLGLECKLKVEWLDECTYRLSLLKPSGMIITSIILQI